MADRRGRALKQLQQLSWKNDSVVKSSDGRAKKKSVQRSVGTRHACSGGEKEEYKFNSLNIIIIISALFL